MNSSFEIRVLDWSAAKLCARAVREEVFIIEQKVPRALEWDGADAGSRHAIALDRSGQCIGTARLLPDGHLGRMAVRAPWRRQGVGTALALALIERAGVEGLRSIVLNAQTHAAPFYRRLGFRERGEVFEEAGIAHVLMWMDLAATTP